MRRPTLLAALLPLLLAAVPAEPARAQSAQARAPARQAQDAELERLVRQLYAQGEFHGGILVADGEDILLEQAWGIADHGRGEVLTPRHRFATNSLGKMFTAILIMRLVERGELALDDALASHLPEFAHPRAEEVTIHMLLSHRSGLPDYFMNQLRGVIPMEAEMSAILETVAGMELDFEPGTMFHYSNTGYVLLGMIAEREYGEPFGEVLRKQIFEPLGMHETAYGFDLLAERLPLYYSQDGQVVDPRGRAPTAGDGAETSSLRDLHRFMLALGSERLLSGESWERIFTPHSLPTEVPEGAWPPAHQDPYGYGFVLARLPFSGDSTAVAAGHGGAGLGSNYVVRFLDSDRIVIVWNNVFKRPKRVEIFEHLARTRPADGSRQ